MKGLFINNRKANDSIHASGVMVYDCLKLSAKYQLDYVEISEAERLIPAGYDFYFFNYHPATMSWLGTGSLRKQLGTVFTMVLEVLPNDPFAMCPEKNFSAYCVLDPTLQSRKNIFAFPRPLEKFEGEIPVVNNAVPVIGSFGFATKGKGFEHVVAAVNNEFEKAVVRINIPYGDFVPESEAYSQELADNCRRLAKPGIDVEVTHDFMSKPDLIRWCAQNDLNCFLYDRNMPGLSATTDQAIVAHRPLAVSGNPTFRHITAYLKPYPGISLRASMESSLPLLEKMAADWTPENFARRFEYVLTQTSFGKPPTNDITLPSAPTGLTRLIASRVKKYRRKLTKLFQSNK